MIDQGASTTPEVDFGKVKPAEPVPQQLSSSAAEGASRQESLGEGSGISARTRTWNSLDADKSRFFRSQPRGFPGDPPIDQFLQQVSV